MSLEDDVEILAAIRYVTDVLKITDAETRARVYAELGPGGRKYALVDGQECATVSIDKAQEKATVTDPDAFLAWCKENVPTAVETVERVRPVDQASILANIAETGEFPDGVELRTGTPSLSVRQSKGQAAVVEAALKAGRIPAVLGLTPITEGGSGS